MSSELRFKYTYRMEGHHTTGNADTALYGELPGVSEEFRNTVTARPEIPHREVEQLLTVIGTTLLTSATVARIIKAYLDSKRTKITISAGDKAVTYEGPKLKDPTAMIERSIDSLAREANTETVLIRAERLPELEK
jgi:hypothetical protein